MKSELSMELPAVVQEASQRFKGPILFLHPSPYFFHQLPFLFLFLWKRSYNGHVNASARRPMWRVSTHTRRRERSCHIRLEMSSGHGGLWPDWPSPRFIESSIRQKEKQRQDFCNDDHPASALAPCRKLYTAKMEWREKKKWWGERMWWRKHRVIVYSTSSIDCCWDGHCRRGPFRMLMLSKRTAPVLCR